MSFGRRGGTAPLLSIEHIGKSFGRPVIRDVTLTVVKGEVAALLGANGAGKSTLFNIVSGLMSPDSGHVTFDGTEITRVSAHSVAQRGIGRLFQDLRTFEGLSVMENLLVGHRSPGDTLWRTLVTPRRVLRDQREARKQAIRLLEYVELDVAVDGNAAELSFGQQRRMALARALMGNPRLLLLDEPAAGLDPRSVDGLVALVKKLQGDGVTIWVIEHDRSVVARLADRVAFLADGKVLAYGASDQILQDDSLSRMYLGL